MSENQRPSEQTPEEMAEERIAVAFKSGTAMLNLNGQRLTALPESIGQLTALGWLYLSGNQLKSLPESLGQLTALRVLYLSDNQLTALPESIGQLTALRTLELTGNQLTALPESLGQLTALQWLDLRDNPALGIPPEELAKTAREILDYYFRTRALAKRPLHEAKLILVGRGGAGKTSLRKRLLTGEWDEAEDKTPGIQITRWRLTLGAGEKVRLNVWDFGGQEIMHATHQFFLTRRSLYLLVLNAREGKQDANIEYWLRLIGAYGGYDPEKPGGGSPALIVVNKCDQNPLDLAEQTLREKFPFIRGFLHTDCRTQAGLDALRAAIERETSALPDLRTPFPKTWTRLKDALETLPGDCITYDAYRQLCVTHDESDDGNQQVLIGFLHDLGAVLHFRDDLKLCDLGVLKPTWVTEGIYGLLNSKPLKDTGGLLEVSRLRALLDPARYPADRHDFLLRLMEKFELCFELPHTGGTKYLIPELLPEEPQTLPQWDTGALGFEYHYNVLPEGLLPRFIVRTHTLSEGAPRWRSGVVLRKDAAEALVRGDVLDRRVWIAVRGPGRQPRELLAIIRAHFEEIHRGISGLTAEERVPVPGYPQILLDYRRLLVREASGKSTVEFETATETIEVPLGKLLDHFETPESRRNSVIHNIHVHEGGRVYVPREHHEIHMSGGTVHGNVGTALATRALPGEKPFPASASSSPCALEGDRTHIVMDIPELITQTSRFLIPALPALWHASKEAAEKIGDGVLKKVGEAAGSAVVEAGRKIWSWLQPHAEQRPGLREAIEEVAARPEDPDAHGTLRTQMRKLLEAQPQLVPELEKIVAQVQVSVQQNTATASGAGAVAIGGNASGVTISTNVTHGHS